MYKLTPRRYADDEALEVAKGLDSKVRTYFPTPPVDISAKAIVRRTYEQKIRPVVQFPHQD
jgi:hypothetical protein